MKRQASFLAALAVLGFALVAHAQSPSGGPGFNDDFREEIKTRYETQGAVSWQAGRIELGQGE